MELDDQALFNSSTEFLVTFDSAEDTKLATPYQHCEDASVVTGHKVAAGDENVFANGQPAKTADSEHIMCEFPDSDTDWFASRNSGAGESVNADDVWLPLASGTPGIHTDTHESPASTALSAGEGSSELSADRKSDYVKHSVDISSGFTDHVATATNVTLLETLEDDSQNQSTQLSAFDQQFTNEHDSIKQDSDLFADFAAFGDIVTENTNVTQTQMVDADSKKLNDSEINQCMQLSEPFPDSDIFSQQLNDGEHMPVPVFTTAQIFDQQLVEFNDEVSLEKREIDTSLPDVHVKKYELITEFSDQVFSEEDVTAQRAELSELVVDASGAITIEEIQVYSLMLSHPLSRQQTVVYFV